MLRPVLLSLAIVLEGAAGISAVGAVPARKADDAAATVCATFDRPSFTITRRPVDKGDATIHTVHSEEINLSLVEVIDIEGKGAKCIKSISGSFVLMKNGDVYEIGGTGYHPRKEYLMRREKGLWPVSPSVDQTGPTWRGRAPVSIAALSHSNSNPRRIGVWAGPRESSIALFCANDHGRHVPYIIGNADIRLRDISYSEALDTPIGSITVLHDVSPIHVEVLTATIEQRNRDADWISWVKVAGGRCG